MQQRKSFQKLRAYADAMEFTEIQIENATKDQIQSQLSLTVSEIKEYWYLWPSMKSMLIKDAIARKLQSRLVTFKNLIIANYPKAIDLKSDEMEEAAIKMIPFLYGELNG